MDQDSGRAHETDRAAPVYSPSFLPLMQSLLTTLANLDAEHEHEVGRVTRASAPASLKPHLLAKLTERHRERRQPYAQHLAFCKGASTAARSRSGVEPWTERRVVRRPVPVRVAAAPGGSWA